MLILIKVMIILSNTDSSYAIGESMNFWYNNFELFSDEINEDSIWFVLRYLFNKLALHWNNNIRESFVILILYKFLPFLIDRRSSVVSQYILRMLNVNINYVHAFDDVVSFNFFKMKNVNLVERRRKKKIDLKETIARELEIRELVNIFKDLSEYFNLMNDCKKLLSEEKEEVFQKLVLLKQGINEKILYINENNIKESSKGEKVEVKFLIIQKKEVLYSNSLLIMFNSELIKFCALYISKKGKLVSAEIPKLDLKMPYDEYEFKNDDSEDW